MSILDHLSQNNEVDALKWLKAYAEALLSADSNYKKLKNDTGKTPTVSPDAISQLNESLLAPIQREFRDLYNLRDVACKKLTEFDYPVLNKSSVFKHNDVKKIHDIFSDIKKSFPDEVNINIRSRLAIIQTTEQRHGECLAILATKLNIPSEKIKSLKDGAVPPMISGMGTPKETKITLETINERISQIEKTQKVDLDFVLEA
tara:strand:+ start:1772 stop:2380 length:609 start_codon:yes stop_codon:yes gene_type:complete